MLPLVPITENQTAIPIFEPINAGFPSPAADHSEKSIDPTAYLIRHPASTFMMRVSGNSMIPTLNEGDRIVVDKSISPMHGDMVIACVNGDYDPVQLCLLPKDEQASASVRMFFQFQARQLRISAYSSFGRFVALARLSFHPTSRPTLFHFQLVKLRQFPLKHSLIR